GLVSRQTRIRPRSRYVPKLSAKSTASSGVKVSPTIPRTPVMPIFNGFIEVSDDLWKLGVSDLILPHDQSKCLHQKVDKRFIPHYGVRDILQRHDTHAANLRRPTSVVSHGSGPQSGKNDR